MDEERQLLLVVTAVATISATCHRGRVDIEIAVVQSGPTPVDMHQSVLVITVIYESMVASRHKHRATHRQFIIDGLHELSAGQKILLQLAHVVVVIVLQGIPHLSLVTKGSVHPIGCMSQLAQIAHQTAHSLSLSVVIAMGIVVQHIVPVIMVKCHSALTTCNSLGPHRGPLMGKEHLGGCCNGASCVGRLSARAAAWSVIVVGILLAPFRSHQRLHISLWRAGISRRHTHAIHPHSLYRPYITVQQSLHGRRHICGIQPSLVAVPKHTTYPIVGRHYHKTLSVLVVEQMQSGIGSLASAAFGDRRTDTHGLLDKPLGQSLCPGCIYWSCIGIHGHQSRCQYGAYKLLHTLRLGSYFTIIFLPSTIYMPGRSLPVTLHPCMS